MTAVDGGIEVSGWAIDPDTSAPIAVHVYVDGVWNSSLTRRGGPPRRRGHAYSQSGPLHGFDATLSLPPGPHEVCAYAINTGLGRRPTRASAARPPAELG